MANENNLVGYEEHLRDTMHSDLGSPSFCRLHGSIPWACDGICGACESEMAAQDARDEWDAMTPEAQRVIVAEDEAYRARVAAIVAADRLLAVGF